MTLNFENISRSDMSTDKKMKKKEKKQMVEKEYSVLSKEGPYLSKKRYSRYSAHRLIYTYACRSE